MAGIGLMGCRKPEAMIGTMRYRARRLRLVDQVSRQPSVFLVDGLIAAKGWMLAATGASEHRLGACDAEFRIRTRNRRSPFGAARFWYFGDAEACAGWVFTDVDLHTLVSKGKAIFDRSGRRSRGRNRADKKCPYLVRDRGIL